MNSTLYRPDDYHENEIVRCADCGGAGCDNCKGTGRVELTDEQQAELNDDRRNEI